MTSQPNLTSVIEVVGHIARKRSMGRHLAFADIVVSEAQLGIPSGTTIKVTFQRDSSVWNRDMDDTFPTKSSMLAYGAQVRMKLCQDNDRYQVREWQVENDPRGEAMREAKSSSSEGVCCSAYLRSRGNAFLQFNENPVFEDEEPARIPQDKKCTPSIHGDRHFKGLRARIFAEWILETFEPCQLAHVLDVAGGKGKLSTELALKGGVPCTIVDPFLRQRGSGIFPKKDLKRFKKAGVPIPLHAGIFFESTSEFSESHKDMLLKTSLLVGLHPDEATEDILRVALSMNKPFAIVPCCVFPGFFPLRHLKDKTPVRTYEEFIQYLLEQDPRIRHTCLNFEGRNRVVYMKPE